VGVTTLSRFTTPPGRLVGWLGFVGALAAIAYAGRIAGGKPDSDILYQYSTAVAAAIQYGLMFLIVLWIGHGLPKRELFALRRPDSWGRAAALTLGALVAIYAVSGIISTFADAGSEQGLTPNGWDSGRAGAYAANFVVVAGMGPIVEELTYRGEGYTLLSRYGRWIAVLGTGLLFALAHGLIVGLPILLVFGVALAVLRDRTESVYPGIFLHMLFNSIALIAAVTIES
jgi:membrane protease YdiL (CAAX protease family)